MIDQATKVWVVIRDATDYNGERTIFGVFSTQEAAQAAADWEIEKSRDWVESMNASPHWVPRMLVEETVFFT